MSVMFTEADDFNQDIGNWDVSNVSNMFAMFNSANVFNQDITGWCVSNISSIPSQFSSTALTDANKPLWGKEFKVALTGGSLSQTVTATNAITNIVHTVTPICAGSITASVGGLPSGVSLAFANNVATISGSANATGTSNYRLAFFINPATSETIQSVTGTITVQ